MQGLPKTSSYSQHPWGIFFTILGTVLLDFDADACQSPSRAYLLDVTVPGDMWKNTFNQVFIQYATRIRKKAYSSLEQIHIEALLMLFKIVNLSCSLFKLPIKCVRRFEKIEKFIFHGSA